VFLYGTALVFKSFISEIAEDDGWGHIEYFDSVHEEVDVETVSQSGQSSRSDLTGLDHLSEGNELD
jgi:hypothetical protein